MFLNLRSILSYRKTFRKWLRVLYKILKHSYPFEITLNNGESYLVYGHTQIYFLLKGLTPPTYVPNDDIMLLQYKGKVLQFRDALENGAIYEIFIEESYKELEIPKSTVIDIGANIGDSSIYFALSGAKKVIAIEPQLKSYESLVSNVKLNELEDIVLSLRAGAGSKHEILSINASKVNPSGSTSLNLKYGGEQLEIIDLHYIVDNFLSEVNSLKIDCEGCEYDFIDGASTEDLQRFKKIMVEYHYGPSEIIEKLEQVGFHISLHPGMRGYNTESKPHFTSTGIIVGTLKNK